MNSMYWLIYHSLIGVHVHMEAFENVGRAGDKSNEHVFVIGG